MNPGAKPLYIDPRRCIVVTMMDDAIHIEPVNGPAQSIPMRHVSQLVISNAHSGLLGVMLKLARNRRPVFITDAHGRLAARLVPESERNQTIPWLLDLCDALRRTGYAGYRDWLTAQKAHACSRILRGRGQRPGDYERCIAVLLRACRKHQARSSIEQHLHQLNGLLEITIGRSLDQLGLQPLTCTLRERLIDFAQDLRDILWPSVLRSYHRVLAPRERISHYDIVEHWAEIEEGVVGRLYEHLQALPEWVRRPSMSHTRVRQLFDLGTEAMEGFWT